MDIMTFFGIIAGMSLILGAIFLGGSLDIFINIPGFMIVMGGTLAAISINYPLNEIVQSHFAAYKIFASRKVREIDVVNTMVKIADGEAFKTPATIDDPAILDEIRAALATLGYPARAG